MGTEAEGNIFVKTAGDAGWIPDEYFDCRNSVRNVCNIDEVYRNDRHSCR